MSEWLDLMLEEIRRKESEAREAADEQKRRGEPQAGVDGRQATAVQEK